MKILLIGIFLLSLILFTTNLPPKAMAAELFVKPTGTGTACTQATPCSLGTALAQAADGDAVYVAGGTYTGTGDAVITLTKNVSLYGSWKGNAGGYVVRDPDDYPTTVQGEDQRQGISISGNIAPTIDGFTITGGKAPDGGGIYIDDASPLIRNNIITANRTITSGTYEDGRGGGVFVKGTSTAVIVNNKILNNNSGYGGGIYSVGSQGVTVEDNLITQNMASYRAGGIMVEGSPDIIRRNVISSNTAADDGGGIMVWAAAPRLEENRILDNTANFGGGISLGNGATPSIFNNLLVRNGKDGIGGSSSSPVIVNNTIVGNGVTGSRGVYLYSSPGCEPPYCATGPITNNVIVSHGIGISGSGPTITVIDYNDVWGNVADNYSLPASVTMGTHNISLDPLFNNVSTDDFHLKKGSPCIDAGIAAGVTVDIDGDLRDDGSPDIGAYEYFPVNPKQGTIGTKINFYGLEYGAKKGKVLVGTVASKILEWTDSFIRCQLTKPLLPGIYDVTVQPKEPKGAPAIVYFDGFTAKLPEIDSVEPTSGPAGDKVTIEGLFFGTKKGKVTLGGKSCKVLSWEMDPTTGESEIEFVVPKRLDPGTYDLIVTTTKVGSDTVDFTIE